MAEARTALVTGSTRGIGRAIAVRLAQDGFVVVLNHASDTGARAALEEIQAAGGVAHAVRADVSEPDECRRLVRAAQSAVGPLDVLVNNAGVAITRPFLDLTEREWHDVMDVNLDGAFRVAQAVALRMRAAGKGGSIVNIASVLAERVAAQVAPYATSKAALVQLTRAMALELARDRIRVNALAPGYIETALNRDFFATEGGQALVKRVPQRRLGRVEDLEGALLLLCSDASSFMTGATVAVDGGHAVSSL